MSGTGGALAEIAAELRAEEPVIAAHVKAPTESPALGLLAAAGPATREHPASYATVVESVREGYLLHYGDSRLLDPPDDDLALLAGDFLYAKGLERLAALGDLTSIRELSDLIGLSAQLHAVPSAANAERANVAWLASVVSIATGPSEGHELAKAKLRESGESRPLQVVATEAAARAGIDEQLTIATKTVGFAPFHLG